MKKIMLVAGPSCLHNSSLWTLFCSAMCVYWDIRCKGVTSSFKHCMPSIRAIGIPSRQSFGIKFTSFGIGYMHAELALPIHGGYCSHFYSHISCRKMASRAPLKMDLSRSTPSLVRTSGTKASHTCQEALGHRSLLLREWRKQSLWKRRNL
jgi:hypothetical protein